MLNLLTNANIDLMKFVTLLNECNCEVVRQCVNINATGIRPDT